MIAGWRQDIKDADALAARSNLLPAPRQATCYACGHPATKWIRSTSQFFSAPRCDDCATRLIAMFASRGVKDVKIDTIGATR